MTGTTDLAVRENGALARVAVDEAIEKVLMTGDLTPLTAGQRVEYYNATCQSLGLNPLTRPFDYVVLNKKLTLYARKDCTEQLRQKREISINIIERRVEGGVYLVVAEARTKDGRRDESMGVVALEYSDGGKWYALRGDALANAFMKAETKAKRRVTLSICGLGLPDETELETIPDAQIIEEGATYKPLQYTCEQCKEPITESDKGASPAQVAAFTKEHLGRQLCAVCAKPEVDARQARKEAAKKQAEHKQEEEQEPPVPAAQGGKGAALASARARFKSAASYATTIGLKAPELRANLNASQLEDMIRSLVAAIIDAINSVALLIEEIPSKAIPGDKATLEEWMEFVAAYGLAEVIKTEIAGVELDDDGEDEEELTEEDILSEIPN
jgi:hypothetical protein